MSPTLYMTPLSPPSRTVLITAKAIGIKLRIEPISLTEKEHLNPDYIKLNPQHTVPTLVDKTTIICDSHAIITYLSSKYGNSSLYPEDHSIRATIDHRLLFDSSVLFACLRQILRPMIYNGVKTIPADLVENAKEAYGFLEKFLEYNKWMASNSPTLADHCLFATATSLNLLVPIDEKCVKVKQWIENAEKIECFQENDAGLKDFANLVAHLTS